MIVAAAWMRISYLHFTPRKLPVRSVAITHRVNERLVPKAERGAANGGFVGEHGGCFAPKCLPFTAFRTLLEAAIPLPILPRLRCRNKRPFD